MRFDTVIRNGTIVTATDTYVSDVGIVDGKISVIGADLPVSAARKADRSARNDGDARRN